MAQQTIGYIQKKMARIAKGKPAKGVFSYLNDLDKLCSIKSSATTVEQFSELDHLEKALAIRAAMIVRSVMKKLAQPNIKKQVLLNDLYAADLILLSKAHHLYMSFIISTKVIANHQFKDENIKPLM